MWASWIRGVSSEGTAIHRSARPARAPPPLPVRAIVVRPPSRAASAPARTFGERPEVEIAMATSPDPIEVPGEQAFAGEVDRIQPPGHQGLPRPAVGLDAPGEDALEAVVVGDGGAVGRVGGQGDGVQGAAIRHVPPRPLGGDVLGVRRRATVAEEQHAPAAREGRRDPLAGARHHVGAVGQDGLLQPRTFVQNGAHTLQGALPVAGFTGAIMPPR